MGFTSPVKCPNKNTPNHKPLCTVIYS